MAGSGLTWSLCAALVAGPLIAATIPLTNPSFELLTGTNPTHFDAAGKLRTGHWATFFALDGANGFATDNAVPGWEGEGENGTMSPVVGTALPAKFPSIPDGQNTFFGTGSGVLVQSLNATYLAGNRYVFEVMVGRPRTESGPAPWAGGHLLLLQGSEGLALVKIPTDIQPGEFRPIRVEYSVAPADPAIGKNIGVAISPGSPGEIHFDAAQLSVFPLPSITPVIAPAVRLTWPTTTNAWYRVERTASLALAQWIPVAPPIAGTAGEVVFFEAITNAAGYYRIVAVPPP